MMSSSKTRALFFLLLTTRLALGLAYSLIVPPWEAYDEDGHFAYVRYLARHHTLLRPDDPEAQQIWEKFQPPLYYILAAVPVAWLDLGAAFPGPERNPYFISGYAGVNYAIHPEQLEGLAYRTTLALLIARGMSVVISTLGVTFVYGAAWRVWPKSSGSVWLATCLYAFWPQLLFIGGMVTNDALVTALAAAAFYLALALTQDGVQLKRVALLGLTLGAALLTKLNAAALAPVVVVALGFSLTGRVTQRPAYQIWLALTGVIAFVALALQFLGSLKFVTAQILQAETVRLFVQHASAENVVSLVTTTIPYGFRTFVASFGWGNFEIYAWVYLLWSWAAGLAVVGLVVAGVRRARLAQPAIVFRLAIISGLQASLPLVLAVILSIAHSDPFLVPGRYLLPALPAVSFALVSGWQALVPTRWRGGFAKAVSVGLIGLSWSLPLWSIAPRYAKPQPLAPQATIDYPLRVNFADEIGLLGYQQPPSIVPGQNFSVTLCWQAIAPVEKNYPLVLEIIGPDGQGYGRTERYPGDGNYPTSFWTMNRRFCDDYTIAARADLPAPAFANLQVTLLDAVGGAPLRMSNPDGSPVTARAGVVPLRVQGPPSEAQPAHGVTYRFGSGIVLKGYEVQASGARVALLWEATENIAENYTVFVHLRDTPTTAYAQGDGPPRGGWYPTSLWQKGEVILDEHTLKLPEGTAPPLDLYVGVLNAAGVRLPVVDAAGKAVANNEVILERGLVLP